MSELTDIKKRFDEFKRNVPRLVATNAVNFFNDRFTAQNWLDKQPEAWKPRKHKTGRETDNRAILIKSTRLQKSIRAVKKTFDEIRIASLDVPYAEVHNEGFEGDITQNVKKKTRKEHTRKGYITKNGRKVPPARVQAHEVRAHQRTLKMKIKRRRFMGNSQTLTNQTTEILKREFNKIFK